MTSAIFKRTRENWDSEATPQEVIDFAKQNYYIIKQREANQVKTY